MTAAEVDRMKGDPERRIVLSLTAGCLFTSCADPGRLHADESGGLSRRHSDASVLAYLQRLEPFGFAGSVAATRRGQSLHFSAHGLADRAMQRPWGADTRFDTGSVTKQFTAAAVLALVADGCLELDGRIGDYLPHAPTDKRGITIHQLLTHTGGMGDGFGGDYDRLSKAEFLDIAFDAPLIFAPGAAFSYSNPGYGLLAAIIEAAAQTSFDAFLTERLFRPLGMRDTGCQASGGLIARGYDDGAPQTFVEQTLAAEEQTWNLIGNGGLHSTMRDLQRWTEALGGAQILPQHLAATLFQPHALVRSNYRGSGGDLHYGYGWFVWPAAPGGEQVWHLGGNGVLNCAIRRHMAVGLDVIYVSNVSEFHDPAYPAPAVERLLLGERLALPPLLSRSPERELDRLSGRYEDAHGEALTLQRHAGGMRAIAAGQSAFSYVSGQSWRTSPRLLLLNDKALNALEASRDGRFVDLVRIFPETDSLEDIRALEAAFWSRREAALGSFIAIGLVGSRVSGAGAAVETIVSAQFEGGIALRVYVWADDDRLIDIYPLDDVPTLDLFLSEDLDLVRFDAAEARELRVPVERGENGPHLIVSDGLDRPVRLRKVS